MFYRVWVRGCWVRDLSKVIGSDVFDLTFDPEKGFSYQNESGDGFGSGGSDLMDVGSSPNTIVPMTNEGVASALGYFNGLSPEDPNYSRYLSDLGLAMSPEVGLSSDTVGAIAATMAGKGLTYNPATWTWESAGQSGTPGLSPTPVPTTRPWPSATPRSTPSPSASPMPEPTPLPTTRPWPSPTPLV